MSFLIAWVILVPLFFVLDGQRPVKAFLIAYCAGILFFLSTVWWLIHVTLPGMIVVVLYLSLYFGLFGLFFSRITINDKRFTVFLIPAAWVACEYLRSNLLTGFGWALLGHSQSGNLTIIQIADLFGAYGVSYIVALVNAAIYLTLKDLRARRYTTLYLMIALTAVFLATAYGTFRLKNIFQGERLRVAVVQGNIPQSKKWDAGFREEILAKYEKLTNEAARRKPDLVIWPETSVPAFLDLEKDVAGRLSGLARSIAAPLLVGAPGADPRARDVLYNSAVFFGIDGRMAGRYDKLHLVPFGEYVPFKRILSFVERFAPSPIGDFSAGREMTVFSFFIDRRGGNEAAATRLRKKVKFSCLICFEDIFPGLGRRAVKEGADLLVNITNDAWFKQSAAPYQHAQSSVFRAVENRVNVARAANTGVSCFINQKGEITSCVGSPGREIFVDGFAIQDIVLTRARTFYTLYGDLFAFACMGALALCLIFPLTGRKGL